METLSPKVTLYPSPPGAIESDRFQVRVGAARPLVERFREVSYARFAVEGRVPVEVLTPGPAREVRVLPGVAVADLVADGARIRFTLLRPANLAVLAAGLERLFLFADAPEVAPPIPGTPGVVSATEFGADRSGTSLATAPLQAAIDEMAARPAGGTVVVPEGAFLTGTLAVRSGVTLYLEPGAVLRGSADPADYPIDPGRHESGSDTSIASPDERYRGDTMTFSRLLWFDGARRAQLAGRGTVDGQGSHLRKRCNAVPNLVRVRAGEDVAIRDVLLRDSAAWTVHLLGARRALVDNVRILNDRSNLNTDGVDPDACQDVLVRNCLIYTKDDGVCVKATGNSGVLADVERIEVRGNVVSSLDAALKVGTESRAARFRGVVFCENDVFDCDRAMSIVVRDGATYERLAFCRIRAGPGVKHLVEQVIGVRPGEGRGLGRIEHLLFEDIEAEDYAKPNDHATWYAQFRPASAQGGEVPVFQGADGQNAVRGLVLRNVSLNGQRVRDRASALEVAGLSIGPFVEDVTIE